MAQTSGRTGGTGFEELEKDGIVVGAFLGEGATAQVYECTLAGDAAYADGRRLAIKIGRETLSEPQRHSFRREGLVLARLTGSAIPRVRRLGEWKNRPYIVMDRIMGPTLAERLKERRLTPSDLEAILAPVLEGLDELHRQGFVHGDLKPENIVLEDGKRAKLIDFGLAANVVRESQVKDNAFGTLLYCPPEQTWLVKRPIDGRADLYSLGVVFYECLTGATPFVSEDPAELVRMHSVVPPADPRGLNPAISAELSTLILRLLAKDPDDRHASIQAVASALRAAGMQGFTLPDRRRIPPGRARETAQLESLLQTAARGKGGFVSIEGPSGIGKTTVVKGALSQGDGISPLVLSSKAIDGDRVPFLAIRGALGALVAAIESAPLPTGATGLKDAFRDAAGPMLPVIVRLVPKLASFLDMKLEAGQDTLDEGLAERLGGFLRTLAKRVHQDGLTLSLVFDDVQWMDESSFRVLRSLAQEGIDESPLLVALIFRNDEESARVARLVRDDLLGGKVERMEIGPLDEGSTRELILDYLATRDIDSALVGALLSRSRGNPLLVREFSASLLDAGGLVPQDGGWRYFPAVLEGLNLPTEMLPMVLKRLEQLPEATRRALSVAAVFGSGFTYELLARLLGPKADEAAETLTAGTTAQVIELREGAYYFIHDSVREALLLGVEGDERREIHQAIAESLSAGDARDGKSLQKDTLYALARHFHDGFPERTPLPAFEACLAAGIQALVEHGNENALRFLQMASGIRERFDLPHEFQLPMAIANAEDRLGRLSESRKHLKEALNLAKTRSERVEVRERLAWLAVTNMETELAWSEMQLGLAEVGRDFSSVPILKWASSLAHLVAGLTVFTFFGAQNRKPRTDLLELNQVAKLYVVGAIVAYYANKPFNLTHVIMRSLPTVLKLGNTRESIEIVNTIAAALALFGIRRPAEALISWVLAQDEVAKDPSLTARTRLYLSFVAHFLGDAVRAQDIQTEVREMHGAWLPPGDYLNNITDSAWNLFNRGYVREAWSVLEYGLTKVTSQSTEAGMIQGHIFYTLTWSVLTVLGRHAEAQKHLDRYLAVANTTPNESFRWGFLLGNQLLALLERGSLGAEADAVRTRFDSFGLVPFLIPMKERLYYLSNAYLSAARARAAGPEARGEALADLRKSLRSFNLAALTPLLRGHYHVVKAECLRLEGRNTTALRTLETAERLGHMVDAPWIAFECSRVRTRILLSEGNRRSATREAQKALAFAENFEWTGRTADIRAEFKELVAFTGGSLHNSRSTTQSTMGGASVTTSDATAFKLQKQMQTLLEAAFVSSKSFDLKQQISTLLDGLVSMLGAERGFVILSPSADTAEGAVYGRGADGQDLPELKGYSTSVIEQVRSTGKHKLVSATDEGAVSLGKSIMVQGLRSIVAVPIVAGEESVGVLYLDSRMAKGMFAEDDVTILTAFANHLATSIQLSLAARLELDRQALAAKLEVERQVLEKEVESKKAIQSILDNLEEGFMVFNQEGRIQEGISKSASRLFSMDPVGKSVGELLRLDPQKSTETSDWVTMLFSGALGFEDLAQLGPKELDSQGKYIRIQYRPIFKDGGDLDRVIMVSSDRSREKELEAKAAAEAAASRLVLMIARDRDGFLESAGEIRGFIAQFLADCRDGSGRDDVASLFRTAHSIKGGAAQIHLHEVVQKAHVLEGLLSRIREEKAEVAPHRERLQADMQEISSLFEQSLERYHSVLGAGSADRAAGRRVRNTGVEEMHALLAKALGRDSAVVAKFVSEFMLDAPEDSFRRFERAVSDVAQRQGKDVRFAIEASEVRWNREPYRGLLSSFVHAFRNAVDHGIESPEEREAAGKPVQGSVTVSFERARNSGAECIRICIRDDGRGIDPEVIGRIAVKKGLVSQNEASRMSPDQLRQLVFATGFSSREAVTDLSGRGVGLDAIRVETEKLGGRCWVESTVGQGTRLMVEVPLLADLPGASSDHSKEEGRRAA